MTLSPPALLQGTKTQLGEITLSPPALLQGTNTGEMTLSPPALLQGRNTVRWNDSLTTSPPARYKDTGEMTLSPPALLQGTDKVRWNDSYTTSPPARYKDTDRWNDSLTTSPPARHSQTGETTLPHSTPARQTDGMTLLHLASQPDHGTEGVTNPPARRTTSPPARQNQMGHLSHILVANLVMNMEQGGKKASRETQSDEKTLPLLADQHEHEQRQGKTTPSARQQGKKQLAHTLLTSPVTKRGPQKTPSHPPEANTQTYCSSPLFGKQVIIPVPHTHAQTHTYFLKHMLTITPTANTSYCKPPFLMSTWNKSPVPIPVPHTHTCTNTRIHTHTHTLSHKHTHTLSHKHTLINIPNARRIRYVYECVFVWECMCVFVWECVCVSVYASHHFQSEFQTSLQHPHAHTHSPSLLFLHKHTHTRPQPTIFNVHLLFAVILRVDTKLVLKLLPVPFLSLLLLIRGQVVSLEQLPVCHLQAWAVRWRCSVNFVIWHLRYHLAGRSGCLTWARPT